MNRNNLLICLFIILEYFTTGTVCDEAMLNGNVAYPQQFRYMVAILQLGYGHLCGGAIIGEQHVLSAAHCFVTSDNIFKFEHMFALLGTNDLMKLDYPSVNVRIVKVYIPNVYNGLNINTFGDIAVLKLERPLDLKLHVSFTQAKIERTLNDYPSGYRATIAGWGWTEVETHNNTATGRRGDSLLRYLNAHVLSNKECERDHPGLLLLPEYICARVEQRHHEVRGVCHGDDGSPLIHDSIVIGVLSKYPKNCTERGSPAIYTRISPYLRFIRNAKEDKVTLHMRAQDLPLE